LSIPKVLEKILEQKKREIEVIPEYPAVSLVGGRFRSALMSRKGSIIAECKKASPSKGLIRNDYNPVQLATQYKTGGAVAISVLTDEKFFQGSLGDLEAVASSVNLPALRKDFIIDKKQIMEAALRGASAVLLIVRILTQAKLEELFLFAKSLGLDVLMEIHTQQEGQAALEVGGDIIGINTRDLDTLQIQPDLISQIAPTLPSHVVCVGESGIANRQDYQNMLPFVQSVLVGTYFMESEDISAAFHHLLLQS
jgi:indole-3-glycerol phosphate synthase